MKGQGRWYNPILGIVLYEGKDGKREDGEFTQEKVEKGDILTFECGDYTYEERKDLALHAESGEETTSIGDIKSAIDTLRQEADDMLQEGEILLMNDVLLRVIDRPSDIWTSGQQFSYKLEVIGWTGNDRNVGIAGDDHIGIRKTWSLNRRYDTLIMFDGGDDDVGRAKGTRWYALMKADFALANNTRRCDVTEVGIVSKVFNQANGLCNFPAVPKPQDLEQMDEDGVRFNTPVQNKYMYRTSFFHIWVQKLGDTNGTEDLNNYEQLAPVFAVSGNSPVDIRNSIRIIHPETESYTFKFVPITSHAITDIRSTIYSIDSRGEQTSVQSETAIGTFHLIFNAFIQSMDELSQLPEMSQGDVTFDRVEVEYDGVTYLGPSVGLGQGGITWSHNQGFFETILGQLKDTRYQSVNDPQPGTRRSAVFSAYSRDGREARIRVTSTVLYEPYAINVFGIDRKWAVGGASFELVSYDADDSEAGDIEVQLELRNIRRTSWYAEDSQLAGSQFNDMDYNFRITGGRIVEVEGGTFDRRFDAYTRIKEIPTYEELSNSCQQGPEHRIAWINEVVTNQKSPTYADMDMLGIQMRTLNSDITVSQVSVYKKEGIIMERLRLNSYWGDENTMGPSSNFADIVHWLLTNTEFGMGREINAQAKGMSNSSYSQYRSPLVDHDSFVTAAKFIDKTPCRFDGAVSDQTNIRNWATEHAQFFMCNFAVRNGQFSLLPALPTNSRGDIQQNVTISALFTAGNILENSFEMEYLPLSDRRNFEAVVKYRVMAKNTLASERTVLVRYKANDNDNLPQEDFDLTSFCTTYDHAVTVGKYLISTRKRIDHVITFKTIPQGLQIAPGDYIKVQTDLNPYTNVRSGVVGADGRITSIHEIPDGEHEIAVYRLDGQDVQRRTMTVEGGVVKEAELHGSLFALPNLQNTFGVYMIEEVTLEEDGAVSITASHHPTTGGIGNDLGSKIVQDMLADNQRWTVKTI